MKRKVLSILLASAMSITVLAGCGSTPATTEQTTADSVAATETTAAEPAAEVEVDVATYTEAPELAELVSAGSLAPVEERIPDADNIFVDTVDANGDALEIGTYGGVINLAGANGSWDLSRPVLESIIRYNTDGSYYPNVIKEYSFNADYTEWTFKFREGMKWSDGDDFNTDDVTFWYYMVHLTNFDGKASWNALIDYKEDTGETDEEGNAITIPHYATLKKVDDYTVTWTFTQPKYPADFIENGDFKWCWAPSHYLSDLIPDSEGYPYVENEYWASTGLSEEDVLANAIAKGIEAATVKDLGKAVSYNFWNTSGVPNLNSYVLCTTPGNNTRDDSLCILERNPYFWKVDAAGNQLPYCDEIHFNKTSEDGQDLLMFRSGEIDIINIGMQDIAATLADMGDAAELRSFAGTSWGSYQVTFNYTCKDENYATLFANPDFRQAISICVDRQNLSEIVSDGFLEPGQCAPSEGNFGYDAEWEQKWTEYDVDAAKKLLEGCGLVMGSDGFYDFADGSDFTLTFYTYAESGATAAYPVLEQNYTAAGIKCATKEFTVEAFDQEIDNNDWYAVLVPHTAIGGLSLRDRVAPFVPIAQAAEWYGEYGTWYGSDGAQGVEPTGDMAKLIEIYEKWNATPDSSERDAYTLDIYQVHEDNLWSIAYLKGEGSYNLISSKIKNYANNLVSADLYQYANIVHYWTLYKAE
ncbi:MAG: hypothetical protein K5682_01205 [Lachnospiraceae bacterium]|nr:hypothetical protein [Lachnospiraceae bacterium]